MADNSNEEYIATGDSGASKTYPIQAGSLKKGMHCVIKGRPCKIIEYSTSKTGKHGHAKAHIVAIDIFTNKKLEELCPTSHNMEAPNLTRAEYSLMDINDEGQLSLLTDDGDVREDLSMPKDDDVAKAIKNGWEAKKELILTVVGAMDEEAVHSVKEASK
ncbi:Eukaryotic translation initiation factor 5A-3 [Diplonema papillatum]|nr:Eukaryotic translation initiation factor 5A-3 [Diplonema papillatum]